jgi:hypothetical protein
MVGKKPRVRYHLLSDDEGDEGEVQGDDEVDDEGHNIQELLICH